MKFFFLLGGFIGFCLTFSSGIITGNEFGVVMQNSAIGCIIGAFLMKGLRIIMMRSMHAAVMERIKMAGQNTRDQQKK